MNFQNQPACIVASLLGEPELPAIEPEGLVAVLGVGEGLVRALL